MESGRIVSSGDFADGDEAERVLGGTVISDGQWRAWGFRGVLRNVHDRYTQARDRMPAGRLDTRVHTQQRGKE